MKHATIDDQDTRLITYLFGRIGPQPTQIGRELLIMVQQGMSDLGEECMRIEVVYKPRDRKR